MLYKKVCPIDSKVFYARKLNTIFCSKKCRNRTRYMPAKLVERLVASVSRYMFNEKDYQKMVLDEDNIATDEVTVTQKQIDDLETIARVKKYEQDQKDEKEKQKSLESQSGFNITEEQKEIIDNTLKQSIDNLNQNIIQQTYDVLTQEPKKYKIKSLQRTE